MWNGESNSTAQARSSKKLRPEGFGIEDEALSEEDFAWLQRQLDPATAEPISRGIAPRLPILKGIRDHSLATGYLPRLRHHVDRRF